MREVSSAASIECSGHGDGCFGPTHVARRGEERLFLCDALVRWHRENGYDVDKIEGEGQ